MALSLLLTATLLHESATAARDFEIEQIRQKHELTICEQAGQLTRLHLRIEEYYDSRHKKARGAVPKTLQFPAGTIGARAATNPALIPLGEEWSWEKIAGKVKRLFRLRYFHPPKPPALDKVKLKKELNAEQLKKCGLKLDDREYFYIELARLQEAA